MLTGFGAVQMLLLAAIWLLPFVIAIWVLRTMDRIRHGVERIASAAEQLSAAQSRAP